MLGDGDSVILPRRKEKKELCRTGSMPPTTKKLPKGKVNRTSSSSLLRSSFRTKSNRNIKHNNKDQPEASPRSKLSANVVLGRLSPRSLLSKNGELSSTSTPNLVIRKRSKKYKKKYQLEISSPTLKDHTKGKKEAYPFWRADSGGSDIMTLSGIPRTSDESSDTPYWACRQNERVKPEKRNKNKGKSRKKSHKKKDTKKMLKLEQEQYHPLKAKSKLDVISGDMETFRHKENAYLNTYGMDIDSLNDLVSKCMMDDIFHSIANQFSIFNAHGFITVRHRCVSQRCVSVKESTRSKIISNWAYVMRCSESILYGNNMSILNAQNCILIGNKNTYLAKDCIIIGNDIVLLRGSNNNRDQNGLVLHNWGAINYSKEKEKSEDVDNK